MSSNYQSTHICELIDSLKNLDIPQNAISEQDVLNIVKNFFNNNSINIKLFVNDIAVGTFGKSQREAFLDALMHFVGKSYDEVKIKLLFHNINTNMPIIVEIYGRLPPPVQFY